MPCSSQKVGFHRRSRCQVIRITDALLSKQFVLWPGRSGLEIQLCSISIQNDSLQKGYIMASNMFGLFYSCCQLQVILNKHLASVFLNCICSFNQLSSGNARRGKRDFPRVKSGSFLCVAWQQLTWLILHYTTNRDAQDLLHQGKLTLST